MTPEQIQLYIAALRAQGVHPYTAAPPFYRGLWRMGISITPPLSTSFTINLATGGTFYGVAFGLFIWFYETFLLKADALVWAGRAIVIAFGSGWLFGLSMSCYFAWRRRNLDVPEWRP